MLNTFRLAIFAGIAIAIGGTVNLNTGGIIGAVLFSFGLLTVVHYSLKLYTGTAGFVTHDKWLELLVILLGNITGCLLTALLIRYTSPQIVDKADSILQARLQMGALKCGLMGIGCGLIMTTAVRFARERQWLPLFFGVPVFIMCGFTHCIADAFYYCMSKPETLQAMAGDVIVVYLSIVFGNLAGCNLYRLFIPEAQR